MSRPGWYAQPFRADGGITADGLLNQLGRPSLSRLSLLVREAAQNSWDARLPEQEVVRFRLDLCTVGAGHANEWRRLFTSAAAQIRDQDPMFRQIAQAGSIRYLAVSDRGTTGLGGPTRSDSGRTERREWLRFVLNSGDREGVSTGHPSGGTFGYGKGAFYRLSRTGCIFIHTRFRREDGALESRFIGSAIRKAFWDGGIQRTGRHWWGLPEKDHCEPLRNELADAAAGSLGLAGFDADETGTTVIVVDPDLTDPSLPDSETTEELTVQDAGIHLADASAWNLWPILLPERRVRMTVAVTANGVTVPVPSPDDDATLASFADAYRKAIGGQSETLVCGNPRKDLGSFAYDYTYGASVLSPAARELGIEGAPHHVCLLRGPELVTRYYAGPERSTPDAGYAGVFKVADDLDGIFSQSEPPTHDVWEYRQLKGREATFVRTTGRRLKDRCDALSGAQAKRQVKVGRYAMSSVSQRLGHLLAGPGGTGTAVLDTTGRAGDSRTRAGASGVDAGMSGGAGPDGDGQGGGGIRSGRATQGRPGGPTRRPTLVSEPTFDVVAGRPVLVQRVVVHGPDRIQGLAYVLTGDGAAEDSPPVGAAVPAVMGWRTADGGIVPGDVLQHEGGPMEVELIVTAVADVVVDISVVRQS
ncbi:hypothetical protein DN069_20340 [Streptacidiphilus pinicola]|uniref:Uncharacterized protein n=1 Tax=Streptacidiphilus pinicola TaxID=2219663 RepID=A0A2X0IK93_9ACTN|nr:hypothetical protein [Streptacidiphilus pinicola]RAG83791.1 hypothetical protein DN069_20340 [Streptacidiphilus pinicola]